MQCQFCKEEIQDGALKCKHCGSMLNSSSAITKGSSNSIGDGFSELCLQPFKKYAVFEGRARRKEYWYFVLLCFVISFVIGFIGGILGSGAKAATNILNGLFLLGIIIPSIAVGIRRMHDTDRSGWWILLPIVNIVFLCLNGQQGQNRFGDDPKGS